jgi:ketosteroid isomerase-like protein
MNLEEEAQGLLQRDAAWSALSKAGTDIEAILDYWSDDAVVYPPGMPPVAGKQALRDYVTSSLATPGFSIEWTAEHAVLSEDASMGYTTGTNAVTVTGEDGGLITLPGRFVAIWRRTAGGDWECVEDVLVPSP